MLSRIQNIDAVKAVIPLSIDGVPSEDEKELYEILKTFQGASSSLEDIDGDLRPLPEDASLTSADTPSEDDARPLEDASQVGPVVSFGDMYTLPPIVVLTVSCIAALLAVICVGAGLYAYNHANSIMIKSGLAWDVLPRLEKRLGLDTPHDDNAAGGTPVPEKHRLLGDAPLPPMHAFPEPSGDDLDEKGLLVDASEPLSDDDDLDEKFHDAPEHSLLFLDPDQAPQYESRPDVPRIVVEEHPDPDLLPLPETSADASTPFATPLPTPARTPQPTLPQSPARHEPQMREVQASPTLSSKPLWSLRAADAPALGLTSPSPAAPAPRSDSPTLPGALYADDAPEVVTVQRPRTRTPRQPLDIAFALQLRPGLGLGADSAWLVRFLMAMFGWMTFVIGGPRREQPRRALTA